MIVVTGGMGFIGSNLVHALNQRGRSDLFVVDDLTDGTKFSNLSQADILDYAHYLDFPEKLDSLTEVPEAIFHLGACSDTTEWDGIRMMKQNFEYSKHLLHFCKAHKVPLIYASSASVYGAGQTFQETREHEAPLNLYGYSKMLFDHLVCHELRDASSQIVGLRYFNVYGPREAHKGKMASVVLHFNQQVLTTGKIKLFEGSQHFRRDFIHVDDAIRINLWFLDHPGKNGIYNVGTGQSRSYTDLAQVVLDFHGKGTLEFIRFPDELLGRYQTFTQADLTQLRTAGYQDPCLDLNAGIGQYLAWLNH
ncbi:ADP-L-glycero-D-mannoheptose-6-epimerase [mine drainage metagenome]|uniref:ADP-L-glycero-D-mannoheptose-6-epimerase n=2 Tax=mine drainage metagenome TaxID=410659 RepID=T0ZYS0_9ZZZZ